MLLPIRTSIRPRQTPYANYALIILNIIVFLLTYAPHYTITGMGRTVEPLRSAANILMLTPSHPHLWQFITYAFLHANFMHIFGNMFFLFLFGNNVNGKLGNIGYICFYLAGGIFSAIGHIMVGGGNVLGASGAVAAVTGAYLILFPRTLITIIYWFIIIGTMEVPALFFIAFKMIFIDNVLARYTPNVAYDAHLSGYAFGMLSMLILLSTRLLASDGIDFWVMVKQWNRRRSYRDTVSQGYDPFTGMAAKKIKVKEVKKTPQQVEQEQKVQQMRTEIAGRLAQQNISAAARLYLELMETDSQQILSKQNLLDIANQLSSEKEHGHAAMAYEQFLENYGNYEYSEQVQLMLGIIYSRYLGNSDLATKHLTQAMKKLTDAGQLQMCKEELDKLQSSF